jgi:glutaminyl-peptide cyclotransferase
LERPTFYQTSSHTDTGPLKGNMILLSRRKMKCGYLPSLLLLAILMSGCGAADIPGFDQENAYRFLEKQCDFGPRVPGSDSHRQCKEYLLQTFRLYTDRVTTQDFMFSFSPPQTTTTASNIIANFQPDMGKRILLCAHWDSRPWADADPEPANRNQPVMGANDGASGVAVLLEIARVLHQIKPPIGVDILLFDAEDAGRHDKERSFAQGSAAFARAMDRAYRPQYGILLDMIGDADLTIQKEANSVHNAPQVVEMVWNKAAELGIPAFTADVGYAVFDDHIPLLEVGIRCIDLIDFDYPYWHTTHDTPDKCSAESLGQVGRLLLALIYGQ